MKANPDEIVLYGNTNITRDKRWGWCADTVVDLPTDPPRVLRVVTSRENPRALSSRASLRDAPGGFISQKSLWHKRLNFIPCKRVTEGVVRYYHAQATRDLAGLIREAFEHMAAKAAKAQAKKAALAA